MHASFGGSGFRRMLTLPWTAKAGEANYPLLAQLKKMGYDGVESPRAFRLRTMGRRLSRIAIKNHRLLHSIDHIGTAPPAGLTN
jgi:hypothetical protein